MTSDLVLTAIDVLAASIFGEPVEPRYINKIRRHSVANQDWPIDELCRMIIHAELAGDKTNVKPQTLQLLPHKVHFQVQGGPGCRNKKAGA